MALVGRARAGKDTAAAAILRLVPGSKVVRLSAAVKAATRALFGLSEEEVERGKDVPNPAVEAFMGPGATPRHAIVWLTDTCRSRFGPDFFSRSIFAAGDGGAIVLPDVRYGPDVDETRRRGGLVVKIERPALSERLSWEDPIDAIEGDVTIVNDGGPGFSAAVLAAVAEYM